MTIAYWCVLIAALLPYAFAGIAKWGQGFDNARPRVYLEQLDGYRQRAHWAQQNAYEMFPIFAVAVVVAHQLGVAQARVDGLAIGYVVARLLYGAAYLADLSTLRSVVWVGALGCVIALFMAAR